MSIRIDSVLQHLIKKSQNAKGGKIMRKKITSIILAMTLVFICALTGVSEAASTSAPSSANAAASVRSGDYMYYSIENKLYKVNVNTKKTTLVYKNSNTDKRMRDLTVKDGWIYGKIVDPGPCEAESVGYIFRVRTSGKDFKKMKIGKNPVIYNGSIYYYKCKLRDDGNFYSYDGVGIYKMTLSGSSEKCIKKSSSIEQFIIYKSYIYYIFFVANCQYKHAYLFNFCEIRRFFTFFSVNYEQWNVVPPFCSFTSNTSFLS